VLFTLNNTRPYQGDESFYTVAAADMVRTGDYLVPVHDGEPRFQKPPLTYWVVAAGYLLAGVSLWAARLPMVVVALLTLLVTYHLAVVTLGDRTSALLSVAVLSSSVMFVTFSRIAMTDPLLTLFCTGALLCFASAVRAARPAVTIVAGYACVALAVMTKGPMGLMPLAAITAYLVLARPDGWRKLLAHPSHLLGLLVLAVVVVPWYAYGYGHHRRELVAQLASESGVVRSSLNLAGAAGNLLFYARVLLLYILPFSLVAPLVALRRRIPYPRAVSLLLIYSLAVLCVYVLFVSMHKDRYLSVIFPSLAILSAHVLVRAGHFRRALITAGAVSLGTLMVLIAYPHISGEPLRGAVDTWRHAGNGTLGVYELDRRRTGWAFLLSGGKASVNTAATDYVLTAESGVGQLPGGVVVYSSMERSRWRWSEGRIEAVGRRYFLVRMPEVPP
jgi:4-amino-4-deoxy-L-arabinose transferase-like glycosyltransferase